jgi:hypothetical protein
MENRLLNTPYKCKKSYGGAPEPQTTQYAPWLRGPSLKKKQLYSSAHARVARGACMHARAMR